MTIRLRQDYQEPVKIDLYRQWSYHHNLIAVMPCGSGKTVLFSYIVNDFDGAVCVIVHRQELVAQISVTLAKFGVKHDIIAPKNVIKNIVRLHVRECGQSYYSSRSVKKVAGVDTLIRRKDLDPWAKRVGLWVQDECHHVLSENKWGKAAAMFPNALGLGVSATPERADGKGLGREFDGVFDHIVEGPDLRWMIDQGYLTDYRIFCPPSDVNYEGLRPDRSGDYNRLELRKREKESHIFGDVVEHFNKICPGKQGITFASNLKSAAEFATLFNDHGIDARMISGETKDRERIKIDEMFRSGDIRQMTNVDLFGEGYDIPILDCVSMARKTASFPLFVQQATRMARPLYAENMPLDTREQRLAAIAAGPKPIGYLIDHVGNVVKHAVHRNGVIDLCYRQWSLEGRKNKQSSDTPADAIPVKNCTNINCLAAYDGLLPHCPYCRSRPKKSERKTPEQVEGDLTELDPTSLRSIIDDVKKIEEPFKAKALSKFTHKHQSDHQRRQVAMYELRDAIAQWAGVYRAKGETDQTICRRFNHRFNIDIISCQTQTRQKMIELTEIIKNES